MTTMDSDSESQDSDEGRRFRFETTRKDANVDLAARRRIASPVRRQDRRSRSRDRSRRERKDERSSHERKKSAWRPSRDERKGSKERKTQKEDIRRKEEVRHKERDLKSHKDGREALRRGRESKSRDEKRRRSPEKSYERNRDVKSREKRERRHSKEREKCAQRASKDSDHCGDLNLSDFDVVSDTEGNYDDKRSPRASNRSNRKRDSREHKVKQSNGVEPGPSNSNEPDLSDFLLDDTPISASTACSNVITEHCTESDNIDNKKMSYGPALPPSLGINSCDDKDDCSDRIIGPILPDDFRKFIAQDQMPEIIGPALPPPNLPEDSQKIRTDPLENEDDDDDDLMGPLPADHPALFSDRVQQQLEYRAKLIKEELAEIDQNEDKKREEWMTELPEVRNANFGVGPRKFRIRPGPDMSDRSGWTDTPADRAKKLKDQRMGVHPVTTEAVSEEAHVEKVSRKREKSLLELHQKKLHKKKKKEEKEAKESGKSIRRPFDRNIDLQVNRFDESRKKSIFMKTSALDDRFSRGKI